MKNKIKTVLMMGSLFLGFQQLQAQDAPVEKKPRFTAEERATRMAEDLKTKLTLTDEQTQKVKALIAERENNRDAEMKDKKNQRVRWEDALNDVLTAEQMTTFRKLQEDRKARMQEQRRQAHQE